MAEPRADAFARLFEAVHEGVYIGQLGAARSTTFAANPHLKTMFGYAPDAQDAQIQPFDTPRFVDPQARAAFIDRLSAEGAVTDYLLRLRRLDLSPVWVEVTAHADPPAHDGSVRIDALVRNVSERKKLEDQTRDLYHQLLQAEKAGRAGPDDFRRGARAEQPARHHPHVGRAPVAALGGRTHQARASRRS